MRTCWLLALTLIPLPAFAGVYSPDDVFIFELDENNHAKAVQYSNGFDSMLAEYRDINVPNNALANELAKRIAVQKQLGIASLNTEELARYTADLLRLNRADEVLNMLHPIARDPRRGGFFVYTHLARAHAARGDGWREAAEQQTMAIKYTEFPTKFGKLNRAQLAWLKKVEKDYYLPWLQRRAEDARSGRNTLNENPDRLFPATGKRDSDFVQYQPNGTYQIGTLDPAEKAKIPPDAIAILQQMLLWHPNDTRLLWQLGELYNAEGEFETAAKILDLCSYTQGYTNPQLLEHRRLLLEAVATKNAALALEREQKEVKDREETKHFWWIVSIAVAGALIMLYYQARELRRRFFT